jgi:O-antigen ligase
VLATLLVGVLTVPFVDRLPVSVQRTLSFLPLNVDRIARLDAQATVEWRLEMWRIVWAEVPRYLWLGKGYAMSPSDQYLADAGVRRGIYEQTEPALVMGNYHSGPLTLLIPFGIWGALGFVWFSLAALRVLYRNYRYGDPALRTVNTFLFAYMITRLGTFYTVYGDFSTDMMNFAGVMGLAVSLNGGVASPESSVEESVEASPAVEPSAA